MSHFSFSLWLETLLLNKTLKNFLLSPAELLQAVYDDLVPCSQVMDIAVEDPSDDFTALRDFVDCQNALRLPSFRPPLVHRPYAEVAEAECKKKLKLQKVISLLFFLLLLWLFLFFIV